MAIADLPSRDTSQKCILARMCPEGGDPYSLIYSNFLELLLNEGPESMSEWMNGQVSNGIRQKETEM